jgi:hypothetical protein
VIFNRFIIIKGVLDDSLSDQEGEGYGGKPAAKFLIRFDWIFY